MDQSYQSIIFWYWNRMNQQPSSQSINAMQESIKCRHCAPLFLSYEDKCVFMSFFLFLFFSFVMNKLINIIGLWFYSSGGILIPQYTLYFTTKARKLLLVLKKHRNCQTGKKKHFLININASCQHLKKGRQFISKIEASIFLSAIIINNWWIAPIIYCRSIYDWLLH